MWAKMAHRQSYEERVSLNSTHFIGSVALGLNSEHLYLEKPTVNTQWAENGGRADWGTEAVNSTLRHRRNIFLGWKNLWVLRGWSNVGVEGMKRKDWAHNLFWFLFSGLELTPKYFLPTPAFKNIYIHIIKSLALLSYYKTKHSPLTNSSTALVIFQGLINFWFFLVLIWIITARIIHFNIFLLRARCNFAKIWEGELADKRKAEHWAHPVDGWVPCAKGKLLNPVMPTDAGLEV